MQLQSVESSQIYAVGYDDLTETLVVISHQGKIHHYFGVSQAVYEELMAAESKSHYLQEHIVYSYPYSYVRRWGRKRHR
ncbi:MAG: hypothetical protein Kow00121_67970 [Elainellaceae cyanobacterium]